MNQLYGLVLCGGKSSRLGFPKYKIEKEGVALYKWWTSTLNSICMKTYISCQDSQKSDFEYPFLIIDESNNAGPLEGIYKAFQLNNKVSWLVIACDLVYAELKDVLALVEKNNDAKERIACNELVELSAVGGRRSAVVSHISIDAICYQNQETGEPFPLFAIYNAQIESKLNQEYQSELKSAKKLLMHSNIKQLIPTNSNILIGVNTPEDLDTWKKSLE